MVCPWLSPQTAATLTAAEVSYLDLTGNAHIKINQPAIYIESQGAIRNPAPPIRRTATLRGAKTARLIRTLIDVTPPYGVRELAAATGFVPGYVSTVLEALDAEVLISRGARNRVEEVDIARLIDRWADVYNVLETNISSGYLAPSGTRDVMNTLRGMPVGYAITGPYAGVRMATGSVAYALYLYSREPQELAQTSGYCVQQEGLMRLWCSSSRMTTSSGEERKSSEAFATLPPPKSPSIASLALGTPSRLEKQ